MPKAHRVENGVSYCDTCYARCFKRSLCAGCGMFKRLLASNPSAKCQACVSSAPCIRCHRAGRPVSKLTDDGPVCNSCYPYFRELIVCESCGDTSKWGSRMEMAGGVKLVCHKCARAHFRTCSRCKFHRECSQKEDGAWVCGKCDALGDVPCPTCSKPMPAGRGTRCMSCYWVGRGRSKGAQLVELLAETRTRQAFQDYLEWAMDAIHHPRLVRTLDRHVEFFQRLEMHGEDPWTEALLLREFKTSGLRKYELPVRWLRDTAMVEISPEAKSENAERGRSVALVAQAPKGSLARGLLQAFFERMDAKVLAGTLKPKSMRLSLRPAVTLLAATEPPWQCLPDQSTLDKMLGATPGQRSAVSTFRKFLKDKHGTDLVPKPTARRDGSAKRRLLSAQLAALAKEPVRDAGFQQRWLVMAMCFFHLVSRARAKSLLNSGVLMQEGGGSELVTEEGKYWIPDPPVPVAELASHEAFLTLGQIGGPRGPIEAAQDVVSRWLERFE